MALVAVKRGLVQRLLCTGVLVGDDVVVFAAHCGTSIDEVWQGTKRLPTKRCAALPRWRIDDGTDVAFCVLRDRVRMGPIARVISGGERETVTVGTATVLVGFGGESVGDFSFDVKRVAAAPIESIGAEIVIGKIGTGTCYGDSGGPAFVRLSQSHANPQWRVLGLLSSGDPMICGRGYYSDLTRFLPWLESETKRDLTPCFDSSGLPAPTPECTIGEIDETGHHAQRVTPPPSASSCESAANCRSGDRNPPQISSIQKVQGFSAVSFRIDAQDAETGVKRVGVELLTSAGALVEKEESELQPFVLTFPNESIALADSERISAEDFGGNVVSKIRQIRPGIEGGCSIARNYASTGDTQSPTPENSAPLYLISTYAFLLLVRRASDHGRRG